MPKLEKRTLAKKTAGQLKEFWDNILSISWKWPPPWDCGSPDPRDEPVSRDVLCWWCRTVHNATEVEKCMALPDRQSARVTSTSSTSSASVGTLLKPYSEIWAFLTVKTYPDGRARQTGRLSLSSDLAGLALSLTDVQTGLYCCLRGQTLDDLLLLAESGLAANDLAWQESKFKTSKNGK